MLMLFALLFSKHSALYKTMRFLGLLVELYRRTSKDIKSICNAAVTRLITGRWLT